MTNKTVYPEWVQTQRTKGTTVKKVGNTYYLYKRTSKRVPGKKYPQPVDTYLGIITPDGVIMGTKKKLPVTSVTVREFGFSKTLWELCPADWKKAAGDNWEEIFFSILKEWSPNSYLLSDRNVKSSHELHFSYAAQTGSFSRRIHKAYGIGMEDIAPLKYIYLVTMGKENIVSEITEQQKQILEKLPVKMEYK